MTTEANTATARRAASFDGETPPRTWFEAPTPAGTARLRVTGGVRHAADAAIVLHRCGGLIDALEEWAGIPLAWRWISAPSSTPTTESHVCALWRFEADDAAKRSELPTDPGWQLELPWTLLRALPAPSGVLAQRLCWPEVPVILAAAQVRLSEDEIRLLEPGGAVILPESMHAHWNGLLRATEEPARAGWGMPVELRLPLGARRIASGPCQEAQSGDGDDGTWCEVRLDGLRTVPGDRLAGWYDGDLGAIGSRASLWRCATDLGPARPLATGTLMPWADGSALSLQVLCEPARPVAAGHRDPEELAVPA